MRRFKAYGESRKGKTDEERECSMKRKRGTAWVCSFLMAGTLLAGAPQEAVYASQEYPAAETEIETAQVQEQEKSDSVNVTSQKVITVTVSEGLEYLDTFGDYLKVDGVAVAGGSVTVMQAQTHTISILPQFGYEISAAINGAAVNGTEENGWMTYSVADADAYEIAVSRAGSSVYTVAWDYDGGLGADACVSNGTVKIISAVLPDGSDGMGAINDQNESGGHVVIAPGSVVTVEIKPDYGYQFLAGSLNGQTVTAGAETGRFTFIMPDTNLHLSALFTPAQDIIQTGSAQVQSGRIANGSNAVDTGNLKLEIEDAAQTESAAVSSEMQQTAGEDQIQCYLNMDLYRVVNKGTQNDAWEDQLTELNGEISVTLELAEQLQGTEGTFYVIRAHQGSDGNMTYTRIQTVYDREAGTIAFSTDKFSTYAIVQEKKTDDGNTGTADSEQTENTAGGESTGTVDTVSGTTAKSDGTADDSADKTVSVVAPKTGDDSSLFAWTALLTAAVAVVLLELVRRKRDCHRK